MANFNGRRFVETSVTAVLKSTYPHFELIFIDDCSTDGSSELVREKFASNPRLVIMRNERNVGAAAARNRAVSQSRGGILIFLDNDTEVEPSWMNELVEVLKETGVGAAQAKVIEFDCRSVIQHVGVSLIPFTAWAIARGAGEIDNGQWDRPDEILAMSTCLAVKRSAFDDIRGFDETLGVYSEDIDFSWRLWLAGHKTILAPFAQVYHKTKTIAERKVMNATEYSITLHLERNSLRMLLKNLGLARGLISVPVSTFINLALACLSCMRTRTNTRLIALIHGIAWNVRFLDDTLEERKRVQGSLRRASDAWILEKIVDKRSIVFHVVRHLRFEANRNG